MNVHMKREEFVGKLKEQFQEQRLIIVSWYGDIDLGVSFANLVIEDKERLEEEIQRVKQFAQEINF